MSRYLDYEDFTVETPKAALKSRVESKRNRLYSFDSGLIRKKVCMNPEDKSQGTKVTLREGHLQTTFYIKGRPISTRLVIVPFESEWEN